MTRCQFPVESPPVPAILPPVPGGPEMPTAPDIPARPGVPVWAPPTPAILPPVPGAPEMPPTPETPSVAILVDGIVVPSASVPGYVPPGIKILASPIPAILPPIPGGPEMPEIPARVCPLDKTV